MDKPLSEEEWKNVIYKLAKECPNCRHPYVQGWICSWCGYDCSWV